jgi:hypothetical protein
MRVRLLATIGLLASFGAFIAAQPTYGQATDRTFVPAGPATWNLDANWSGGFRPEAQYNEQAVINGDKSAYVDDAPPLVGRIGLDAGTLEIRPGGSLTAETNTSVNGELQVGAGVGVGTLIVRRGGTLNAQNLNLGGGTGSKITLGETGGAGAATLSVAGGTLNRTTRIVGPIVSFSSSGGLTFGNASVLNPVITGAAHSTINVAGAATLGGTLRPEFSGYTPTLGASWNLVTAGSLSGSFSVDSSLAPAVPRGAKYLVTTTGTTAILRYSNALILNVNRATGAVHIQNAIGSPIQLEGYSISSPSGNLSTTTWNSLQDQAVANWDEAGNSNASRLTEFKTAGTTAVNVGSSLSLGSAFAPPTVTQFGQQTPENLTFQYAAPGLGTVDGIVEYVGRRNNLVLTIDPATGAAAIQNESPLFNVSIDAYSISSASGKLKSAAGGWNSLDDQNLGAWDEADNSNNYRLTEFSPSGSTALPGGGTVLNLGNVLDVAGGLPAASDLGFKFKLSTGQTMDGIIAFGSLPVVTPPGGDYNGDGRADGADFLAWQRAFGSSVTPGSGADGSGNGVVDAADLTIWKNGFGSATAAGQVATEAVPEPTTFSVLLIALGCLGGRISLRAAAGDRGRA